MSSSDFSPTYECELLLAGSGPFCKAVHDVLFDAISSHYFELLVFIVDLVAADISFTAHELVDGVSATLAGHANVELVEEVLVGR